MENKGTGGGGRKKEWGESRGVQTKDDGSNTIHQLGREGGLKF